MAAIEVGCYVDALAREGELLVRAVRRARLDARVPDCPGWRLRDLLAHIGYVHRWATGYVTSAATAEGERRNETEVLAAGPPDEELCTWVEAGSRALVRALAAARDDLDCWTFLPAATPRAFWARRQAHETTIHRVDVQRAAGVTPNGFAPEFAADGVDEVLRGFLGRRRARPVTGPAPLIGLEATDHPVTWALSVLPDRLEAVEDAAGSFDLVVRAPIADLYLLVWNRSAPQDLEVRGDRRLLRAWEKHLRIVWR